MQPEPPVCCPPTDPPTHAAHRRHSRAATVPCEQAYIDAAAYRRAYNLRTGRSKTSHGPRG